MIEVGQLAFGLIVNLLTGVIEEGTKYGLLPFFERRKVKRRLDDAVAEVVEPLIPFLSHENIPEDKQRRLINACVEELAPLTQRPERLFQGSLNGQKIFDELYANRDLPQVVVEDGLKDIYTLLCPRIATLLCKIPAAVKDWENEAWSENYKRLDEITAQLRTLFNVVDELATSPLRQTDEILSIARRLLAQKISLELDLMGLRVDSPKAGKFGDLFIHPEIKQLVDGQEKQPLMVGTPDESFALFTQGYSQVIIIGPAGAGKSTWTKWLQQEGFTNRWNGISIRVELRRFSSKPLLSLHELIRETVGRHLAEDLTSKRIRHWLDRKQIIFILDGFDEIRPSERDKVYNWVVDLEFAAQGCPLILTSRPLTTDYLDRLMNTRWQGWKIEPFDEPRIVDYIQRWYTYMPSHPNDKRFVNPEQLARKWHHDSTIKPLTGNPLLLSTLLMVNYLDGSLPSGRSELYRRYVEGMLGLWDDRRKVSATGIQLTLQQKRQILQGFALKLFFEEQDQLDESVTLSWLQEFLKKMNILLPASEVLSIFVERSGLIIGPGIYSFAHKSIAEYLVAESVLQGDQRNASGARIDRLLLFKHHDDDRWNTVTFLWAGLVPVVDIEEFIKLCLDVKNWALAHGILKDQYDRISRDTCRRLILQSITTAEYPKISDRSGWSICFPSSISQPNVMLPTCTLRGLSVLWAFNVLVKRVVDDGLVSWLDYIHAKEQWRDHLWMCFSQRLDDLDTWKACLASPSPSTAPANVWLYAVAESVFSRCLTERSIKIEDVLAAYQEACPQFRGLIPFALMSIGLMITWHEVPEVRQSVFALEKVNKLLEILPDSDRGHIIPKWLLGTSDWIISWGRLEEHNGQKKWKHNDHIGDLFAVFIEEMEKLVGQGHIERNEIYERAIQFVGELQDHRDRLEATI